MLGICWVYGYVPPTRVDFSLPKIQNRPRILNFFQEEALIFKVLLWNRIYFRQSGLKRENDRPNPNFLLKSMPVF